MTDEAFSADDDIAPLDEDESNPEIIDDEWPAEDLEAAYRRALETNDAVEWELAESLDPDDPEAVAAGHGDVASENHSHAGSETGDAGLESPAGHASDDTPERITAKQVIEATLFVGGEPLTSKKLCYIMKGDYDLEAIEYAIEELNRQYLDEARPYEIRLGEGGYRMVVRSEFERIRHRVFGIGPREVKLSQDALEVLALVAYRQPISPEEMEELGKSKPSGMLRQLLRRELIALERDSEDRKRVTYSTTRRFLSLFGIGSIDELPQADELSFK